MRAKRWVVVSCIIGESEEPRVIDGRSEWPTAVEADRALGRYVDLHGLDPDDFTTQRKP